MAQEFAKAFYKSKAWRLCRESYISKRILLDGGLCERCKEQPGYILHHKIRLNALNISDPDVALNHCNLEWVCHGCHDDEHFFDMHGERVKPVAVFDCNGNMVPIDNR